MDDFPEKTCMVYCVTGTFDEPVVVANGFVEYQSYDENDNLNYGPYFPFVIDKYMVGTEIICFSQAVNQTFLDNKDYEGNRVFMSLYDDGGNEVAYVRAWL